MVIKAMIPLTVIMNEEELLENRLEFLQKKFAEPLAARAAQDPQAKSVAGGDVFTFLVNAEERLYDELPVEVKELLDPSVREPF